MRPLRFPFFILLTLTARIAAADEETDNFREDVFACEEAIAHIASCCPQFAPEQARCVYRRERTGSCGVYTDHEEDPGVAPDEAECLLDLDCGTMRERGVCERALSIRSRTSWAHLEHGSRRGTGGTARSELLCR
jgi:hypothetical protein